MRKMIFRMFVLSLFMLASTTQADAQLQDILNKVVSKVTGTDQVTEANLKGTWTFSGSGIEMKSTSDNAIVSALSGTAASSVVEKKVDEYLKKVGIESGKMTITFKEDNTFEAALSSGKKTSGTYSISDDKSSVTLKVSKININCKSEITSSNLKLMVTADKLLSLASTLTSVASSNTYMKAANKVLSAYKGMDAGMKFARKK